MYKTPTMNYGTLNVNKCVEGEPIEVKVDRVVTNKEPIKDGAPLIYTERKEGIRASTNIRTDRWEVAIDAADKVAKSYKARREENAKPNEEKPKEKDTKGESSQGTETSAETSTK